MNLCILTSTSSAASLLAIGETNLTSAPSVRPSTSPSRRTDIFAAKSPVTRSPRPSN